MRIQVVLGLITIAVALGMSHGVCSAQPECNPEWFSLYDPIGDPPCDGLDPKEGWAIYVDENCAQGGGGSCDGRTLNRVIADVEFYSECSGTFMGKCAIATTSCELSAWYPILEVDESCIFICQHCP
jgi:hypothetical protein